MREIIDQKVSWNEKTNKCTLDTLYKDEKSTGILSEPMTSEEAAQWQAEHKY